MRTHCREPDVHVDLRRFSLRKAVQAATAGRGAGHVVVVVARAAREQAGEERRQRLLEHWKARAYDGRIGLDGCPNGRVEGAVDLVEGLGGRVEGGHS